MMGHFCIIDFWLSAGVLHFRTGGFSGIGFCRVSGAGLRVHPLKLKRMRMRFLACCMLVECVLVSGVPVLPSRWGQGLMHLSAIRPLSILAF